GSLIYSLYMTGAATGDSLPLNQQLAFAQFNVIRKVAQADNCVIMGRCADYVLRNRDDVVRVFIMADEAFRVKTMMGRKGLSEEQARKLVKQVDKDRASYYKYYTDQIWGEKENFDLCINSARTGVEGAAQIIRAYIDAAEKGGKA
ncbi:MAG: cytidylate kinase-like family protein, partial [Oscillospiraceae bacterium]|nr:cytidylate kinase-like family protein [Oscillospiraceae bacterium]